MGNQVFANGREIACKNGVGKSIAAFPDVCLSPPTPPAGPVPIPYPVTAMDSDTTDGTKNVKISGGEVMLRDSSNFKKCTGDEACTKSLGMGVITHQQTGKVFFAMWSMDVKIEGANAVRHLDMVTQNHMSKPGQTPPWTFAERAAMAKGLEECKTEVNRAKKKCQPWKKKAKCPDTGVIKQLETKRNNLPEKSAARKSMQKAVVRAYERFAEKIKKDPCQQALRCLLVPYEVDDGKGGKKKLCCEKQTPHHIVEASAFFDVGRGGPKSTPLTGCGGYDTSKAPCVCAEGPSQTVATHAWVHTHSGNSNLKTLKRSGRKKYIKFKQANKNGSKAVNKAFPTSGCSEKCIEAQIKKYHKDAGIDGDTDIKAVATGRVTTADVKVAKKAAGCLD